MNSKNILFFVAFALAISCTEKQEATSFIPYYQQPTVPMYDQMLLKGDVLSVTTRHVKQDGPGGKGIEREYVEFDESRKVTKFIWDDMEMETGPDSGGMLFSSIAFSYAFFEYPIYWATSSIHSITLTEGDYSLLQEWNDDGRYTRIRYLYKGEPVKVDALDDYELEKYLYDEKGFPHYTFAVFESQQIRVYSENTFDEFDEHGNPTHILVKMPNGSYDLYRTIVYR